MNSKHTKRTIPSTIIALVITAVFFLSPFNAVSEEGPPGTHLSESLVIQQYRKSLLLDPENINIRYQLGLALLREKRHAEAVENLVVVLDKLPENSPDALEINYYVGLCYAGLGELDMAAEAYQSLDEMDPKKARDVFELDKVLYNLGIAYQKKDNLNEALKAYEKSIRITPDQGLAYCRKGEILFDQKNYAEALDNFKTCQSREAGNGRVKKHIISTYIAKGLALITDKKFEEALIDFKKAFDLDPKNENVIYFQGYLYYQTGDYRQALSILTRLSTPENKEILSNLPSILQNIGIELQTREDLTSAETAFKKAIEYNKKDADLHYLLGVNYKKRGDQKQAMSEIKEALRIAPEHQKANLALAIITEKHIEQHLKKGESDLLKGSYAAALVEFGEVLDTDPNNQRAIRGRHEAETKVETARIETSKKLEEDLNTSIANAQKYMDDEKYRDALLAFRSVLALDPGNMNALTGIKSAEGFIKDKKDSLWLKGERYMDEDNFYLALREYRGALAYDPDDSTMQSKAAAVEKLLSAKVAPFIEDAALSEEKEKFLEAVASYAEALKYDPENYEAANGKSRATVALDNKFRRLFAKGRELLQNEDYLNAAEKFKAAQKLKPADPSLGLEMSKLWDGLRNSVALKLKEADKAVKAGRYADAIAAYEEAHAADDKNKEAYEGLQNAKRLMGEEVSRRMSVADDAFHQGRYNQAYSLYGDVLAIDKNNKTAKKMQGESRQKFDDSVASLVKKGVDAYNSGDNDEADHNFRKALSIDAGNATAKRYLSMMERPKPRKSANRDTEKLYLHGIELYTEGKYVDAIKQWEMVLQSDPKNEKAALNIQKAKRKLEGVMDVK